MTTQTETDGPTGLAADGTQAGRPAGLSEARLSETRLSEARLLPRSQVLLRASALLLIAVTLGFAVVQVNNEYQSWQEDRSATLSEFARRAAARTERHFDNWKTVFRAIAETECVRARTPHACGGLFARIGAQFPEVVNFAATDRNGRVFASSIASRTGTVLAQQAFFKTLAAGAPHAHFDSHTGPLSGERVVGFAVPLRDSGGRFDGLIGLSVRMDQLARSWESLELPSSTDIVIIDRNHTVAYTGPAHRGWIGRTAESIGLGGPATPGARAAGAVRFSADGVAFEGEAAYARKSEWSLIAFRAAAPQVWGFVDAHASIVFMLLSILLLGMATLRLFAGRRDAMRLLIERDRQLVEQQQWLENTVEQRTASLRETELQLSIITDTMPARVARVDRNFRYLMVNRDYQNWFARDPSGIIGMHMRELVSAATWEELRPQAERALAGEQVDFEAEDAFENIGRRWVRRIYTPERDRHGQVIGFISLVFDISGTKNLERQLRDSEARLDLALRSAEMGTWQWDIPADRRHFDDQTCRLLGLNPAQFRGTGAEFLAALQPEDRGAVQEALARTLAQDVLYEPEYRVPQADGSVRCVAARGRLMRDKAGNPAQIQGVVWDVTRQRQAEQKIRQSEEQFRTLADQSPLGLALIAASGKYEFVNSAFTRLTGYTLAEVPDGSAWFRKAFPDAIERRRARAAWKAYQSALSEDASRPREYEVATREGGRKLMLFRPVTMSDGRWCVLYEDITEHRRIEETRLRSQKLESLGTLSGGIAHDFNNLLLAINGNARLALEDLEAQHAARRSVAEIAKAGQRAADLVRRILAFSRPHTDSRAMTPLRPVVEEALSLLRSTLPAAIELRTRYAEPLSPVAADSTQVHEAVVNLATNAAYAIGEGAGWIEFALEALEVGPDLANQVMELRTGPYLCLSVSDNGCGTDQGTIERMFDAFFTTKPIGQGTGLGLSMVHGIMKAHGGAIGVHSAPGVGTTFQLYFPVVELPAGTQTGKRSPAAGGPCAAKHVLYVDDEEALVFLVTRVLERLGHSVTGFTDPEAALQAFRARPHAFDAVVTDLSMPGLSGFDLAREIRALRPDTPLLLTSGHVRPEDEQSARLLGIREVILKPDTANDLGEILDRLFRESDAAPGPAGA